MYVLLFFLLLATSFSQPNIPSTWTATADFTIDGVNFLCSFTTCTNGDNPFTIVQDDDNQRRVMMVEEKNKFAPLEYEGTPAEWFNISIFSTNDGTFNILNELCYPEQTFMQGGGRRPFQKRLQQKKRMMNSETSVLDSDGYTDLFAWVSNSKYQGNISCLVETNKNEICEIWRYKTIAQDLLLVAYGNEPIFFNYTLLNESMSFAFYTFFPQVADDSLFDALNITQCYDPPKCPANGTSNIISQDLYIFHPSNQFDIAGQDIGDALGDTFFVCEEQITGAGDNDYEWISHWSIQYDATIIGQYQNCNGYPSDCQGTNTYYIGREAALGLGYPLAGQCQNNPLTGNWLSLPIDGQCFPNTSTLGINCTWSATRIKTINSTCLFDDLDFNAACATDGRAPFYNATNTFLTAFSQPISGGCPDMCHCNSSLLLNKDDDP